MNKLFFKTVLIFIIMMTTKTAFSQSNFSSKLINIGVVVSDLDRALDFYVNGIGMVKAGGFSLDQDFTKRSGLSGGIPFSITVLKLEDSPEATEFKLMSFGKKAAHKKSAFVQDDLGMQYMTINVKSLKPVIDRLTKQKVKFLGSTPIPLNKDQHFVLVQDPDGTFVELIGPLN
jgi:catechol 2,3-dioxygenase-like lactoylglutathione lyase family enzyme